MKFLVIPTLVALALAEPVIFQTQQAPLYLATATEKETPLPDQYIIKLRTTTDAFSSQQAVLEDHLSWLTGTIANFNLHPAAAAEENGQPAVHNSVMDFFEFTGYSAYSGRFSSHVLSLIRQRPEVEYIDQDRMISINHNIPPTVPTDIGTQSKILEKNVSWGLGRLVQRESFVNAAPYKLDYDYKYDTEAIGSDVTVYVVDTGIKIDHEEFGGRARWGKTVAWFSGNEDGNGHGTHCAGIIGGSKYGVAKNVSLVAVKVLSDSGSGAFSWIIGGLNYVMGEHNRRDFPIIGRRPPRKTIVSMSLGGGYIKSLNDATDKLVQNGVVVAVAAGNEDSDACTTSPASADLPLTVGASAVDDKRAFFSNWGKCVNVFAPGHNIYSSWNEGTSSYKFLSGTSMATPYVAGVAATIWSKLPANTSALDINKILVESATKGVISDVRGSPNALLYNAQQ